MAWRRDSQRCCCVLHSSPNPSSHTMAVEAAIEALRATLDLVSQTKMGQLFKLLDLLSRLQVLRGFFFGKCRVLFDSKNIKKITV